MVNNYLQLTFDAKIFVNKNFEKYYKLIFSLFFIFVFQNFNLFAQSPSNFTTSGTWVAPVGVTNVTVQAWGAGGAGGYGGGSNRQGGGGGGGGAFQSGAFTVTSGNSYTITVGTGGVGGTGNGGDGTVSTATFNSGTITANPGLGGRSYANGFNGGNGGSGLRSGGNGGNGSNGSGSGGGGGCAGSTGNGGNGGLTAGGAAGTGIGIAGAGADGTTANSSTGNIGNIYGGGGSGGTRNREGGNGADGYIRITFTCPTFSAGANQNLATCATTTTLAATAVSAPATGSWSVVSGSGTVTTPTSPTSTVTGIVPGTPLVLRWSVNNGRCGITTSDVTINSPIGPSCLSYCTPTGNLNCTLNDYIANVTYNTLNNTTTCNAGGYTNFAATGSQTTTVMKSSTYNLSLTVGAGTGTHGAGVWIDWNQNGVFTDAGEFFLVSNAITPSTTTVIPITVPLSAATGNIRMRVRYAWNITVASTMSCTMAGTYGETEDYTITTVDPAPCVAPTAQPTALNLVPSGNSIAGSFTAAVPTPDSYLVVISTSPIAPAAPVNGTNYTIGSVYQPGYTVVDNDTNTNFNATGLTTLTTYYFYIYSFNNLCTGGPLYLGTSPLTGNTTTLIASYCTPTANVSTRYIESISTAGYITNINNPTTGLTAGGYANYTALPPVTQIPGGGVTIDYYLQISRQFLKVWVDWNNDGTFTDAAPELVYTTGGIQTIAGAAGFVIPGGTLPGNYRIRIRSYEASQTFGPCGNLTTGETEDYTLTVVADCAAKVTAAIDGSRCDVGSVVLGVQGTAGVTQYRFYNAQYGGTLIGTQAAVPGTTNWNTPALASTTTYYVSAFNGVCESWYREPIIATINPVSNITVTPSVPEVCGENNIVQISAGGDFVIDYLVNENFEGGGFGVLTRTNVAADANTQWTNRTSPYVPTGFVWKPAITSKTIGNRFALAVSDFAAPNPKDTQLRTAALNTTAFSDLYLDFRHYFSYYPGEPVQFADVDVSTNGGAAWTNIAQYVSNQGFAGQFNSVTLNLSAYVGLPSVMIRFRYNLAGGSAWADGWALDDIKVYGTRPLNTTFTWTGGTVDAFTDLACTIPYVAQSVSTVYVRPTALQLASTSWSFTANATLGNGCPISKLITINNKTKLWKGTADNNWYNPNNWEPVGVPDANTCVFIYPGSPASNTSNINTIANDGFARTLTVRPSGVLNIHPGNDLTVTDLVTVDAGGTFNIENSGSLIQVNNVANSGNIVMKRDAITNSNLDYVYWSTPVAGFSINNIIPTASNYRYHWVPTVNNGGTYAGNFGNWASASGAMITGKGYIKRGMSGITSFTGVPNNGNITTPILRSTYVGGPYAGPTTTLVTADDDNWNLLGNPYPSAISADAFLAANSLLNPFVKIWTHGIDPSAAIADPFYQNFVLNYSVADYITYNALGGTQFGFDGRIAAGQGFFVLMNDSGAASSNATFNNSMRSNTYRNDQFYRNSENNSTISIEKHRIWLKLISPTGSSSDALVGYATGASNAIDETFDAISGRYKASFEIYSVLEDDTYAIQGRSLPFDENDIVPIGVVVPQNGIYTIALSKTDGLFATQNIYLEDKQLGIIYDIKNAPYTFMANSGRYNNRFQLRYTNSALNENTFVNNNSVFVYANESLNIQSNNLKIKDVTIFDLIGRTLLQKRNVNQNTILVNEINKTQSGLIINVTLEDGSMKTFKTVY